MTVTARKRIIILDGPGGPPPEWYLPRLSRHYDLSVFWHRSGDQETDAARSSHFDGKFLHFATASSASPVSDIVAWARRWNAAGVLGFSEMTIGHVQAAAFQLNLPTNPATSSRAARDKHFQRQLLQRHKIPVPKFRLVRTMEELRSGLRYTGSPAILKPVDGVGSMATVRVHGDSDLEHAWKTACERYREDPRGTREVPVFLLEEFLTGETWHRDPRYGTQVSVESLVHNGTITHLAVTDKLPLHSHFREVGDILPTVLPDSASALLYQTANRAIRALRLQNSAVHTEIMMTPRGPRVIEVNARIGGGVSELLHYSCHYDAVSALASVAIGAPVRPPGKSHAHAAFLTPQSPSANVRLTAVPTPDELRSISEVVQADVLYPVGASPAWHEGTKGGTLARIYAVANSADKLLCLAEELQTPRYFSYSGAPSADAEE